MLRSAYECDASGDEQVDDVPAGPAGRVKCRQVPAIVRGRACVIIPSRHRPAYLDPRPIEAFASLNRLHGSRAPEMAAASLSVPAPLPGSRLASKRTHAQAAAAHRQGAMLVPPPAAPNPPAAAAPLWPVLVPAAGHAAAGLPSPASLLGSLREISQWISPGRQAEQQAAPLGPWTAAAGVLATEGQGLQVRSGGAGGGSWLPQRACSIRHARYSAVLGSQHSCLHLLARLS